jgi:hypothetical protein
VDEFRYQSTSMQSDLQRTAIGDCAASTSSQRI